MMSRKMFICWASVWMLGISVSAQNDLVEELTLHFDSQAHPVTFTTPEMIAVAKTRISKQAEPWYSNYLRIKRYADASLERDIVPYTRTETGGKGPTGVHEISARDFSDARNCALVWLLEGGEKYRDQAKEILLKWARTLPEPLAHLQTGKPYPIYDADLGLMAGVPMIFYSHAYTLMVDELSEQERADIRLWMDKVARKLKTWHLAWTANNYYGDQLFNNHLSWHIAAIGNIGFALQDARMAAFAIDDPENPRDFKEMLAGAVLMPGDQTYDAHSDNITAGEIYDRYRSKGHKGLGYAMYHSLALAYLAEAATNNGIDLYAYTAPGGENLLLPYLYYAEFIEKNDSTLKNGLYTGDAVPVKYVPLYDLINTRYPGHPEIRAVLKTHGHNVDLCNGEHAGTVGVTHTTVE